VYVGFEATAEVALGGETFQPPSRSPNLFAPPYAALVARVTSEGEVPAAWQAFSNRARLRLAPLSSGDVIATSVRTEEDGESTTIARRVSDDGAVRWEKRHHAYEVQQIRQTAPERVVASIAGHDRIGLWWIDASTGEVAETVEIEKTAYGTGDRGGFAGVAGDGTGRCAYGETGDDVVLGGVEIPRPSYGIQPFMLAIDGPRPSFVDVADVIGSITAVGTIDGRPAAQLHVIHPGADKTFHRGEYVVIGCAADRALIPVYQYRHRDDDWEHAPAEHVMGAEIHGHDAMFLDDAVVLAGVSRGGSDAPGCVARIALTR
jgi:hypothetical protein